MWEVENNINEKKLDVMKLTLKLNKKKKLAEGRRGQSYVSQMS